MKLTHKLSCVLVAAALAGCASMAGDSIALRITGAEEVPPVATSASGTGSIRVTDDRDVSGSFKTQGAAITAAHIHEGAAGAKLTEGQYAAYKQGRLYVNFHSAAYKGGEIRAQIKPAAGAARSSGY